jgi:competence protein ComEA
MRADSASAAALWVAAGLLCAALPPSASEVRPVSPAPRSGAARLLWGLPLDLNQEDPRTLEALPGIGPARARAIAAARPFCRPSDLGRVPGIGPATLRRLAGQIAASGSKSACGD